MLRCTADVGSGSKRAVKTCPLRRQLSPKAAMVEAGWSSSCSSVILDCMRPLRPIYRSDETKQSGEGLRYLATTRVCPRHDRSPPAITGGHRTSRARRSLLLLHGDSNIGIGREATPVALDLCN